MDSKNGMIANWAIASLGAMFTLALNGILAGADAAIHGFSAGWAEGHVHAQILFESFGIEPKIAGTAVVVASAAVLATFAWLVHRRAVAHDVATSRPKGRVEPANRLSCARPDGRPSSPEPVRSQDVAVRLR